MKKNSQIEMMEKLREQRHGSSWRKNLEEIQ
jgi:hypothetical protein